MMLKDPFEKRTLVQELKAGKRTDLFTKQSLYEGKRFEMTLRQDSLGLDQPPFRIKRICNSTLDDASD